MPMPMPMSMSIQQQQQQPPMQPPIPPPLPPSEQQQGYLGIINTIHLNNHPQNAAQTIVLTYLPNFLRGVRILRDATYPCGSARTVHIGCCVPYSSEECRKMKERGLPSDEEFIMEELKWRGGHGGVAIIKMTHFIGAQNFAGGMLALISCAKRGKLPIKPSRPDGVVAGIVAVDGANVNVVENNETTTENKDSGAAVEGEEQHQSSTNNNSSSSVNENDEKEIDTESLYTKEEQTKYYKTLSHFKQMRVYHLFNHFIPDPIPPDMNIPQADPTPSDPAMPYYLLEAITALHDRYEQDVKDGVDSSEKYSLSTGVSYINDDQWGGHAAAAGTDDGKNNNDEPILKMDKTKIAAAAGGVSGYDEDADPLNAPDVIKAVVAFKRRLEDQNFKGKERRVKIINDQMSKKVNELIEQGRRIREERKTLQRQQEEQQAQGTQQQQQPGMVPPPPPPPLPPQPTSNTVEATDTGRRGVSNLPAWMTKGDAANSTADQSTATDTKATNNETVEENGKKRKFVPSEANRDINVRKQKLDMEEGQSLSQIRAANEAADKQQVATSFVVQTTKEGILSSSSKFPALPSTTTADALKQYVTSQIIDYLGEEESTLIDFIMKELQKEGGGSTISLLEEMKVVLDEDAEEFVLGLYRKMTMVE